MQPCSTYLVLFACLFLAAPAPAVGMHKSQAVWVCRSNSECGVAPSGSCRCLKGDCLCPKVGGGETKSQQPRLCGPGTYSPSGWELGNVINGSCQGPGCPPGTAGGPGGTTANLGEHPCEKCPPGKYNPDWNRSLTISGRYQGCVRCPTEYWQTSPPGATSAEQCTCNPSKLVKPDANCSSGCRCFDNHREVKKHTNRNITGKGNPPIYKSFCEKCVEGEKCPPIACVGGTRGRVNSSMFVVSWLLLLALASQEQWTYGTY